MTGDASRCCKVLQISEHLEHHVWAKWRECDSGKLLLGIVCLRVPHAVGTKKCGMRDAFDASNGRQWCHMWIDKKDCHACNDYNENFLWNVCVHVCFPCFSTYPPTIHLLVSPESIVSICLLPLCTCRIYVSTHAVNSIYIYRHLGHIVIVVVYEIM
jgi:hypothetical protein